jgi:hypothetical protein
MCEFLFFLSFSFFFLLVSVPIGIPLLGVGGIFFCIILETDEIFHVVCTICTFTSVAELRSWSISLTLSGLDSLYLVFPAHLHPSYLL